MVEETIQVIRETEAKADAITRDAEVKGNQIVDGAEKQAKQWKEEQLAVMEEKMQKAMSDASEEGERVQAETLSKIEKEVIALKELASAKEGGSGQPRNSTIGIISCVLREGKKNYSLQVNCNEKGGIVLWRYCRCSE